MRVWRITDQLLMRGQFADRPGKIEELRELGVTRVLCMLRKTDPDLQGLPDIAYGNYPLSDSAGRLPVQTEVNALRASDLAVEEIAAGGRVLVHCIAARDRAPFTCALTLYKLYEVSSGTEAIARVQALKPNTFFNVGMRRYLETLT